MIPAELRDFMQKRLCEMHGNEAKIIGESAIGGGCINNAIELKSNAQSYFLKWNNASRYPSMFDSEAKGLNLLRDSNSVYIPEVITSGEAGSYSFLMLEYISAGRLANQFWENFGKSLSDLHRNTDPMFGLDHDNYIGSLPQSNTQHASWSEFFIAERLAPQLQMAHLGSGLNQKFEKLFSQLNEIFPEEPPTLLHGDLWSGNYMVSSEGEAVIMDGAVYYGHREMDLGMTRLFGGFDSKLYAAYNESFSLEPGWEDRMDICNLYPLLVHVNLFGSSYLSQVESIMRRF